MESTKKPAKIETLLPEIDLIGNHEWRTTVCDIWKEAYGESHWENISDAVFSSETPGFDLISHTRAVTCIALKIAEEAERFLGIHCDNDTIVVLCLLHDVCKLVENDPKHDNPAIPEKSPLGKIYQHGFMSGYYAQKRGLPERIVADLVAHSGKSKMIPATHEGLCMYYADVAVADHVFLKAGHKLILSK